MSVCIWCGSPAPDPVGCCVPALLWQINVKEAAQRMLNDHSDVIGFLDLKHHPFVPPDNPPDEEQPP